MIRVSILNGKNKNYDTDLSKLLEAVASPWVILWCLVEEWVVNVGNWFCQVTRWAGINAKTFYSFFEIQSAVSIDTSWSKKVWLEFEQENIDTGSINNPDGLWIATINTGTNYPTKNYVKLASITTDVITDERDLIKIPGWKLDLSSLTQEINTTEDINTDAEVIAQDFITPTGSVQDQIDVLKDSWTTERAYTFGESISARDPLAKKYDWKVYKFIWNYFSATNVSNGRWIYWIVDIDSTHFLVLTADAVWGWYSTAATIYCQIATVTWNSISVWSAVSVLTSFNGTTIGINIAKITNGSFAVCCSNHDQASWNSGITTNIVYVNGTTVTSGTQATVVYAWTTSGWRYYSVNSICKVKNWEWVIAYGTSAGAASTMVTIYDTNWTGTLQLWNNYTTSPSSHLWYTADDVIFGLNWTNVTRYTFTYVWYISTIVLWNTTALTCTVANTKSLLLPNWKNLIAYQATDLKMIVLDNTTSTPSLWTASTILSSDYPIALSKYYTDWSDNTSVCVVWNWTPTKHNFCLVATNTVSYSFNYTSVWLWNVAWLCFLDGFRWIACYWNYAYIYTNGSMTLVGMAQESWVLNDVKLVTTKWGMNSWHTGLMPMEKLFVDTNWNYSYSSVNNVYIGKVYSPTEVLIDIDYKNL